MDRRSHGQRGHLDEMELALLQEGTADATVRAELIDHAVGCDDCALRVAAYRRLCRNEAVLSQGPGPPEEIPDGPRAALLEAFRSSDLSAKPIPQTPSRMERLVFALRTPAAWLHEPDEPPAAALAWAAAAPASGAADELPVLATENGQIRVRFRRPSDNAPLRAYLLAPADWPVGGVSLHVPARHLSFRLGMDGTVDLPGVLPSDLESGVLELRLEPERVDDTPGM
jgi:hypothetical protein